MGNYPSVNAGPQSFIIPNDKAGEGAIHRHPKCHEKLLEYSSENVRTLYDNFRVTARQLPNNRCFGTRVNGGPFVWTTYAEALHRADSFGAGLLCLGMKSKDMLGIYSVNRAEWVLAEHGALAHNIPAVPLYDTLGPDACMYIINQAELSVVVCSADKLKTLLSVAEKCPTLKHIVQMEDITDDDLRTQAKHKGVALHSFDEVEKQGAASPREHTPPVSTDLATICYTSGTTGDPKGAMLLHSNLIADLASADLNGIHLVPTDVHISYLPLAHMFERLVVAACFKAGAAVGFYQGDILKLFDDIKELRPTVFASVPRLFNRLYDKVISAINTDGGLKKSLFDAGLAAKKEGLAAGYYTHAWWDWILFSKIAEKLGGRVRIMVTGSAPISSEVLDFLRICFSCPVIEGYGQTETAAAATTTRPNDLEPGHVGGPLGGVEIKLVDVPEMEYLSSDKPQPRGEICFRGPIVFPGYFRNEEKTKEAIDAEGWLHSGDIGTWTSRGCLKVIDRKKNIFKLQQGEYVAPEKIENIYGRSPFVMQSFVYGDSMKASLVAIIVPNFEHLKPWAEHNKISHTDSTALCKDPVVVKAVMGHPCRWQAAPTEGL